MPQTFCARWRLSISGPYFLHLVNMTTLYRLRFRINSPNGYDTRSDMANAKDAADDLLIWWREMGNSFGILMLSCSLCSELVRYHCQIMLLYTLASIFFLFSLPFFVIHICYSVFLCCILVRVFAFGTIWWYASVYVYRVLNAVCARACLPVLVCNVFTIKTTGNLGPIHLHTHTCTQTYILQSIGKWYTHTHVRWCSWMCQCSVQPYRSMFVCV